MSQSVPDTLYYDGNCPLCLKEVARLNELADQDLVLCDIFELEEDTSLPERDTLLRELHLKTSSGALLTGVDANVAAWRHTDRGFLFAWMTWPIIKPCMDALYRGWARWRYRRLYGDQYRGPQDATG